MIEPLPPRNAAPEEEPEVRECASCLWELNADAGWNVTGDLLCDECAAEWAMDIWLAETRHDFTPTRDLSERWLAVEIISALQPRIEKRLMADEEKAIRRTA